VVVKQPSVLHFTQGATGGCQITSMILGALGGCKVTLNFLRSTESDIEREVVLELFPASETEAVIEAMEFFQCIFLLLNLSWFLANQIALMIFMIAEFTTSLL